MGSLTKGIIGKEDLEIQTNTNAAETFTRLASAGSTLSLTKFPDIWGGTGKISVAQCETSATDPTDSAITSPTVSADMAETVALGTLTHDALKTKINEILATEREVDTALTALENKINALLAAMRVAGFFS